LAVLPIACLERYCRESGIPNVKLDKACRINCVDVLKEVVDIFQRLEGMGSNDVEV